MQQLVILLLINRSSTID